MGAWHSILATMGSALGLATMPADAQQSEPLRIGILTDMSGVFSDISGPGAVLAISWDVYKILSVIPGDEAFLPLANSVCPMLKH